MEVLPVSGLVDFTGNPEGYYSAYVSIVLEQATDLFADATCLDELPAGAIDGSTRDGRLAANAVYAMAEALYESAKYRRLRFTPFRSENMGSYSYALASRAVLDGIPTGVAWFDHAVSRLARCFGRDVAWTSVAVFDRPGDERIIGGKRYLEGPADKPFGEWPEGAW